MTALIKIVRRVSQEAYGHGKKARKLLIALEKGDLITIHEHRRRTKQTARVYDVLWWMLRSEADRAHMERLRQIKARKASRLAEQRQRSAERRLFRRADESDIGQRF
jgi:transcription initiation factor IIE alpha subunit